MADRVGQQLGNYRLIRLLGRGGFAEVYLGEHQRLQTQAAIKVLRTQLADDDVEGFLKEARTIAHLEHPHIVRVLDFDVEEGTPFLVMSYAPNGNLRQRHAKGTILPLDTILSYVKQLAGALQYAHDEKLIHRDIKPENMLLGRHNDVLLSDFGIALVVQSSRLESTQEAIGTAAYMAPEQFQGKPRFASDQYALGVVVYEWLSGERPFNGSFPELYSQHMFVFPPSLYKKIPTVSPAVERVVLKALAKDSKERFSSVLDFAKALEQACQLVPPPTKAAPASHPPMQPGPLISPVKSPLLPTTFSVPVQPPAEPRPLTPSSQSVPQRVMPPLPEHSFPPMKKQAEVIHHDIHVSPYEANALPYISPPGVVPPKNNLPNQMQVGINPRSLAPSHQLLTPASSTHELRTPQPLKRGISRRTVVLSLAGLGLVGVATTLGTLWSNGQFPFNMIQASGTTPNTGRLPTQQAPAANSSPTATSGQLPSPASFQTISSTSSNALGIAMKYPRGWVETPTTQPTQYGLVSADFHPQRQLGIDLTIKRIPSKSLTGATIKDVNQANIDSFGTDQNVKNLHTITSPTSQQTVGGVPWTQQDASFTDPNSLPYHFTVLSVLHNQNYYSFTFYAPNNNYDEAMQKYFQPILNSFQFLT